MRSNCAPPERNHMRSATYLAVFGVAVLSFVACSGDDSGGNSSDDTSTDTNAAPVVSIVKPAAGAIVPSDEAITFTATVSDDRDAPDALTIEWTSDLVATPLNDSPANSLGNTTFDYPSLEPGTHLITVVVTDTEGLTGTDTLTLQVNEPPGAVVVAISPATATTADDLEAVITTGATDPNRAASALTYSYRWFKDGEFANVTTAVVAAAQTAKGETWEVRVVANDGMADGAEATASVTVVNSPPSCDSATLLPSAGDTMTDFDCLCTGWRDPDGDTASDTCAFFDGATPIAHDGSCTLPAAKTDKGMNILCEYTPSDGDDAGEARTTASAQVLNAGPTAPEAALAPATADATTALTCTLATPSTDPDGDNLTYTVGWRVDGYLNPDIAQSELSGSVLKTALGVTARRGNAISCQIVASDGQASSAPGVSAAVTLANAAPVLGETLVRPQAGTTSVDEGAVIECVVNDATDPDGDSVTLGYVWYVNGEEVAGVTGSVITGADFDRGDAVTCGISANDGQGGMTAPKLSKNSVTIGNAPPTLVGATITPAQPTPYDLLTCTPTGWHDPDGDPLEVSYAWFTTNGLGTQTPIAGAIGGTYTPSIYAAGTLIMCEVTPKNGATLGPVVQSSPIALVAPEPRAPVVVVVAPNGAAGAVRCDFVEPAKHFDGAVTYTYYWVVTGQDEVEGAASISGLSDCDLVSCRAVATDGVTTLSSQNAQLLLPVGDDCATGNDCKTPQCEPTGGCDFVLASDIDCDDGDPCTVGDQCELGFCLGGGIAPEGTPCDDGLFCTDADTCNAIGTCVGGDDPCAQSAGSCLVGACNEYDDTCLIDKKAQGAACSDGSGCTEGDVCSANGVCIPGTAPDCSSAGDACNAGTCNSTGATTHTCVATPLAAGTACESSNVCKVDAACDGEGGCVGGVDRDCVAEIGDACNSAFCNPNKPRDTACQAIPQPNGTPCDDADECTITDACSVGVCIGTGNACIEERVNANVRGDQQPSIVALGFGRYLTQWWGTASPNVQLRFSDGQGSRENEELSLTATGRTPVWSTRMATRPGGDVATAYYSGQAYVQAVNPCYNWHWQTMSAALRGAALNSDGDVLANEQMQSLTMSADLCYYGSVAVGRLRSNSARSIAFATSGGDFGFVVAHNAEITDNYRSASYPTLRPRNIYLLPPTGLMQNGTPVQLVAASAKASGDYWDARLATDGTGNLLVAWVAPSLTEIQMRRFQQSGQPAGASAMTLVTASTGTFGDVRIIGQQDGSVVVIWESQGGDGDGLGVFGQRFDVSGSSLGSVFRVSSATTGDQRLGEVARFSDDGFVVVFDDRYGDADGWGVKARRYSANGSPQGADISVNTFTSGAQYLPTVEVLQDDDWVVGFVDNQGAVWTRRFEQDGSPMIGQVERRLNDTTAGDQRGVRGAAIASGDVLAAYDSPVAGQQDGEILARIITPYGGGLSAELQLNTYNVGAQRGVAVAGGQAHFAAVWQSAEQDGSNDGVFGRFIDATGAPTTVSDVAINATTAGFQRNPDVAMTTDDAAAVVWSGQAGDGSISDIFARVVDYDGTPVTTDFIVNTDTAGLQDYPAIAADDDGNLFIAWQSMASDGSGLNIHARKFDAQGGALGDEVVVNTELGQDQTNATIAVSADGTRVTACWQSLGQDTADSLGVFCQVMNSNLGKLANEVQLNVLTANTQRNPVVRYLSTGNIVVGWESEGVDGDGYAVQYRRMSPSGVPFGARVVVNRTWTASQDQLELVPLPGASLISLWRSTGQDGDSGGIYFRDLTAY
ncbi:MAG: hypothetical protein EP329_00505 [Deltaproteobacteria bacterium]|nr:MAG: hypothetical protein EP329_00505 [Deltaproteobacteria bacterium]